MPWAQVRYRTGRSVVLGASLAGLLVLDTFLDRLDMFHDYVAITPSLWWDDGRIANEAAADLARHGASDPQRYLTMADEGYRTQANVDIVVAALEKGAPAGLGWADVDRSGSEEHRTMYMISAPDALRTFFLIPPIYSVNRFEFPAHRLAEYSPEARQHREGQVQPRHRRAHRLRREECRSRSVLGPVPADEAGAAAGGGQSPAERR